MVSCRNFRSYPLPCRGRRAVVCAQSISNAHGNHALRSMHVFDGYLVTGGEDCHLCWWKGAFVVDLKEQYGACCGMLVCVLTWKGSAYMHTYTHTSANNDKSAPTTPHRRVLYDIVSVTAMGTRKEAAVYSLIPLGMCYNIVQLCLCV